MPEGLLEQAEQTVPEGNADGDHADTQKQQSETKSVWRRCRVAQDQAEMAGQGASGCEAKSFVPSFAASPGSGVSGCERAVILSFASSFDAFVLCAAPDDAAAGSPLAA
jgi:hypothetical protein